MADVTAMQTESSDREDTTTSANWDNPTGEGERWVITLPVCGGKHCSLKKKQHGLHCLSLHHQHICRSGKFHRGYAFTYSNELLQIHSKLVKWAIRAGRYFHQGPCALVLCLCVCVGVCCINYRVNETKWFTIGRQRCCYDEIFI